MRIGEFSIWEANYSDTKCSGGGDGTRNIAPADK